MEVIVFDWDGTLVDTLPAITRANAEVLASLGVHYDDALYRAAYSPDWRSMYRRLGVPEGSIEEAGARWLARYRSLMGDVQAFPGALEALGRLSDAGYRMGLVTAGDRPVVEHQLVLTGLGPYLPVRVCGDDMPFSKPHPAPLRRALEELEIADRPEAVIYVGDAPDDMRMARSVGAIGIGIESILGDRDDLVAVGAAEIWASVADWVVAFTSSNASRAGG